MKKLILTISALGIAVGAFAQGAVGGFGTPQPFVSFGTGHTTEFDSGLYSGSLTMQIYFSSTATAAEITAINNLNGTALGSVNAQNLFAADGFVAASGVISGLTANGNSNPISGLPTSVQLNSAFSGGTIGYYAMVFTGTAGAANGFQSVIASGNGTSGGGNYGAATPGTPYNIGAGSTYASYVGTPNFNDIDLTSVVATPEPTSMALAGLGGLALLGLRRKK